MINKAKKKKRVLPSSSNIVNIETLKENNNIILKPKDGYFNLPFYLEQSVFYNSEEYTKFIKTVEKMVRTSSYYTDYIAELKMTYGLNHCMILSNINDSTSDDNKKVSIEMHHGPLMTLYDVVSLITNDCLFNEQSISSFKICDLVLKEHFQHNIQVIMLCKTVHQAVHKGKIFINPKQCIGDIGTLLEKYSDGITQELSSGINKYLSLVDKYETSDNGLLITKEIKQWAKDEDLLNIFN